MKKDGSNDFKNMLKQSIISIDQKNKNTEDNDNQLNEIILKEKVPKNELSNSSIYVKQFNINNNENIESLKVEIVKPKKEKSLYNHLYQIINKW